MVNRIGKPGDRKLKFPLAGFNILGVFRIPGLDPITWTCQLDTQKFSLGIAYRSR
jgi:hypothetical protein